MAISQASCILCGSLIEGGGVWPDWMHEFRVLYTAFEQWEDARISGVGKRLIAYDVIPLESFHQNAISHSIVDEKWVQIQLMKTFFGPRSPWSTGAPLPLWGFAIHSCCWDLLCDLDSRFRSQEAIQILFDICRSQPIDIGVMNWGHNYGDLLRLEPDTSDLLPGEEPRLDAYSFRSANHTYNPKDVDVADRQALDNDDSFHGPEATSLQRAPSFSSSSASDIFRLFPIELVLEVFTFLASTDVRSLRIASRACATVKLSGTFWRSRFMPGMECDYLWPVVKDAKRLGHYKACFMKARLMKDHPNMLNRRRIWILGSHLSNLLGYRLRLDQSMQPRLIPIRSTSVTQEPGPVAEKGRMWMHARAALSPLKSRFVQGCRALFEDNLTLNSQVAEISASVFKVYDKCYISGLTFTQTDGEVQHLGYTSRQQYSADLGRSSKLSTAVLGFQIALDAYGIRGLRVIFNLRKNSLWMGDSEGLAKTIILFPNCKAKPPVFAIQAGMDALKLVSLSFLGSTDGESSDGLNDVSIPQAGLWFPDVPDPKIRLSAIHGPNLPRIGGWLPYSTCLFGGKDGNLLPYLTRITVWTNPWANPSPAQICSIEFHFDQTVGSSNPMVLGRTPDTAQGVEFKSHNLELDSLRGERLDSIDVLYDKADGTMVGLQFHTNYDQLLDISSRSIVGYDQSDVTTKHLNPGTGMIIGIYAKLEHEVVLHNLGILGVDRL